MKKIILFCVKYFLLLLPFYVDASSVLHERKLVKILTALDIRDFGDMGENSGQDKDALLHEIEIVLINMYEKIINATIAYCLLNMYTKDQNFSYKIAQIVAEDIIVIVRILKKYGIQYLHKSSLSWEEKVKYSLGLILVAFGIKISIDSFVGYEKIERNDKKEEQENAFLNGKFEGYR